MLKRETVLDALRSVGANEDSLNAVKALADEHLCQPETHTNYTTVKVKPEAWWDSARTGRDVYRCAHCDYTLSAVVPNKRMVYCPGCGRRLLW